MGLLLHIFILQYESLKNLIFFVIFTNYEKMLQDVTYSEKIVNVLSAFGRLGMRRYM